MVCPCCGPQCSCLRTTAEYPIGAEHPEGWNRPALEPSPNVGLVTLEVTSCLGSGAEGTVEVPTAFAPCDYEAAKGPITGATVTNGGSGYAIRDRVEPLLDIIVTSGSGAGGTYTPTFSVAPDPAVCSLANQWILSSFEVTGGSGYAAGDQFQIDPAAGDTVIDNVWWYELADVGGSLIASPLGAPARLYREDSSLPAIVDVTVTINQTFPSNGADGAISAVVDTDTSSPTFGQVTGLTVDQGGEGYVTVTPCDFGNTLYITWHDRTGQKPIWIEEQSFNWNTGTDGVIYEADENGDPILAEHVRCGAALLSASFDQEGAIAPYYNFGVNCDPKEGDPLIESASMANAYLLWPSLECRCSQPRKLYVSLFLNYACNICTETGVDNYSLSVGRELCYSWEIDPESGCPVGDAVLTTLSTPGGGPEPWRKVSPIGNPNYTTVETAPCMDTECDPFLMGDFPEISFLPP